MKKKPEKTMEQKEPMMLSSQQAFLLKRSQPF